MWIHWRVVDAHFVMQVRPCAAAAHSDVSNNLPFTHVLTIGYCESGKVSVARLDTVAVIDFDQPPISVLEIRVRHNPIRRSQDGLPVTA